MIIPNFTIGDISFKNYIDCSEEELLNILHYRNLDGIAKWMNNTDIISQSQHFSFVEALKTSSTKLYFCVSYQNKYVGSIYIIKKTTDTWERGLYVIPEFQGSGLTSTIEEAFMDKARNAGIKTITAEVKENNIPSIKYHEKMGYKIQLKINNILSYNKTL